MLNFHHRGDPENSETKGNKNPSSLEKLISSGKEYISKTGKALAFTTALTTAVFLSGCDQNPSKDIQKENSAKASTTVSQTQENSKQNVSTTSENPEKETKENKKPLLPYEETFSVPVYEETHDGDIERNELFDENFQIHINTEELEENKLSLITKLKDYKDTEKNPRKQFYFDRLRSSPLIIHPSNTKISEISQEGITRVKKYPKWEELSAPKEEKLEIPRDKIREAIEESYFESENKNELQNKPANWYLGFMNDLKNKPEHVEFFEKMLEKNYNFTLITPFEYEKTNYGEEAEKARKTEVVFEKPSDEENIWILQGASLMRHDNSDLFGYLEKKLIGPIEMEKGIDLLGLREGKDFEWLDKKKYRELVDEENHDKTKGRIIPSTTKWTDKSEKKITLFPNLDDYCLNVSPNTSLVLKTIEGEEKKYENLDLFWLYLEDWGNRRYKKYLTHKSEPLEKKHIEAEDTRYFRINLGEGKGKIKDKYLFELIVSNDFYEDIKKRGTYGTPEIVTRRKEKTERDSIITHAMQKTKQSKWVPVPGEEAHYSRFLTKRNYPSLDELRFGLYITDEKHLSNAEPIVGTKDIGYYFKPKKHLESTKINITDIDDEENKNNNYLDIYLKAKEIE